MAGNKQVMDSYLVTLSNIVTSVERVYGLQDKSDSGRIADLDVVDLVKALNKRLANMGKDEIGAINHQAGREIVLVSYLRDRLDYFNKVRLDFSKYPELLTVAKILLKFTNSSTVTADSIRDVNMILEILSLIEEEFINYRGGLGYRYLRIFVVLVIFGNYFNAAVIARFLLNQFIVKGDE